MLSNPPPLRHPLQRPPRRRGRHSRRRRVLRPPGKSSKGGSANFARLLPVDTSVISAQQSRLRQACESEGLDKRMALDTVAQSPITRITARRRSELEITDARYRMEAGLVQMNAPENATRVEQLKKVNEQQKQRLETMKGVNSQSAWVPTIGNFFSEKDIVRICRTISLVGRRTSVAIASTADVDQSPDLEAYCGCATEAYGKAYEQSVPPGTALTSTLVVALTAEAWGKCGN